jgi:hypothetical protein
MIFVFYFKFKIKTLKVKGQSTLLFYLILEINTDRPYHKFVKLSVPVYKHQNY